MTGTRDADNVAGFGGLLGSQESGRLPSVRLPNRRNRQRKAFWDERYNCPPEQTGDAFEPVWFFVDNRTGERRGGGSSSCLVYFVVGMARARKSNATFIAAKQAAGTKHYAARYRSDHPLLQGRVPARVYREAQKRARAVDFSLSKWLGYWLELTFADHPMKGDA